MKKYVLGILFCSCLLGTGIGCSEKAREEKIPETEKSGQDEITIMHVDADYPEFQKFIDQAEKDLDLKIHIVSYPENADNRQAEVSTILSAGEDSVDIFSVNDEMVSEFKYKGYLEPLNDTVMTEDILSCYPESYMQNIAMLDGKVYSVPYSMDIMVFWINKSMIGDMEIRTQEDFQRLLETDFGEGRYGYGSAWDSAYVYNELSEFINFFGGSYYDWNSPSTREALTFLMDMVKKDQTPIEQITDQYEQVEQKFLEGIYASIFVYSGTMDMFVRAGAYREDFIQLAPLPEFKENATNIAAWQYVLNKSSANKEAAIRFLQYAASREGSIAYAEYMNQLPARLDIIREEELDIPGFEQLREYVENTELKERPFSRNTMGDITSMGALFQRYVLEEISLEEFCKGAQNITDGF